MMSRVCVCVCVVSSFFLSPLLHLSPLLSCHLLLLLLGFLFALAIRTLNPSLSVSFASSLFPLPLGKKEKRGERGKRKKRTRGRRERCCFLYTFKTCSTLALFQSRNAKLSSGRERGGGGGEEEEGREGVRERERERDQDVLRPFLSLSLSLSLSVSSSSFPSLPSFL